MTFTDYAVAPGGMLASLEGVGLVAACLIKAKAATNCCSYLGVYGPRLAGRE